MRIIYVAAFSNPNNKGWFSLGRERKVFQIIDSLTKLGHIVIGLNIAPSSLSTTKVSLVKLCSSSIIPLRYAQIAISSWNFFKIHTDVNSSMIIWLYNTRTAEAIVALIGLFFRPNFRLILQLEDLPSARNENHGLAGKLDHLTTRLLSNRASHIFSVSRNVEDSFKKQHPYTRCKLSLLPPALNNLFLEKVITRSDPFNSDRISILYAGSYSAEKGVNDLIEAFLPLDPKFFKLILVGSAPEKLVAQYGATLGIYFTGVISNTSLFDYYTSSDVIVNPHRPIKNSEFIFPFKLIEIVSSGGLPLTTPVPGSDIFGLPDICFFSDTSQLTLKLKNSKNIWISNRASIVKASENCRERYSETSIQQSIQSSLI